MLPFCVRIIDVKVVFHLPAQLLSAARRPDASSGSTSNAIAPNATPTSERFHDRMALLF